MFKKVVPILLIVLFAWSMPAFSDSIDIDAKYQLGLSKKLLYETARVLNSKDNILVLDEIAGYDWNYDSETEILLPYLSEFRTFVNDFKSVEQRRDLLHYMNEQSQSMSLAQLVPNAISVGVLSFASGDPLRAIIAIGGTALSSATNYATAKQKAHLELVEKEFELNQTQQALLVEMYNEIHEAITLMLSKYDYSNDDFVSINTLHSFFQEVDKNKSKPEELILQLNKGLYRRELSGFPEYWATLATAYFQTNRLQDSLNCIAQYENVYVKTMFHDINHATMMQIKACCIEELMADSPEKYQILDNTLKSIISDGDNSWPQLYFCFKLYEKLADGSGNTEYLEEAYDILFDIVTDVAGEYETQLSDYYSGMFIIDMKAGVDENIRQKKQEMDSQQLIKENRDDDYGDQAVEDADKRYDVLKKEIKELEKNKTKIEEYEYSFLPPNSSFLVSIAKELFSLATELGYTTSTNFETLKNKLDTLITDVYSREYLFVEDISLPISLDMKYDHRLSRFSIFHFISGNGFSGKDVATLYIPLEYVTIADSEFNEENTKFYLNINTFKYELKEWSYRIEKTNNNKSKQVVFTFTIDDPIDTDLIIKKNSIPTLKITIESNLILLEEPFDLNVDKPKELMKAFKTSKYPE